MKTIFGYGSGQMNADINISKAQIAKFCHANHVTRLALLGDAVPDYYPGETRVKMLVEYVPGSTPGGFAFVRMQRQLGEIIGQSVDLHALNDRMRSGFWPQAIAEAQNIYAA